MFQWCCLSMATEHSHFILAFLVTKGSKKHVKLMYHKKKKSSFICKFQIEIKKKLIKSHHMNFSFQYFNLPDRQRISFCQFLNDNNFSPLHQAILIISNLFIITHNDNGFHTYFDTFIMIEHIAFMHITTKDEISDINSPESCL